MSSSVCACRYLAGSSSTTTCAIVAATLQTS